jgi:hypothetical protein
MYIIFAGTTDFKVELEIFLEDNCQGYTLLNGVGAWENNYIPNAQVIVFFNFLDASLVKDFLVSECGQFEVEILELDTKTIGN